MAAAGCSSAVIEVARLCAMFSCRTGNPVLTAKTIDDMLAAVNATRTQKGPDGNGSHGYPGFHWAANIDLARTSGAVQQGLVAPGAGDLLRRHVGRPLLRHRAERQLAAGCYDELARPELADRRSA